MSQSTVQNPDEDISYATCTNELAKLALICTHFHRKIKKHIDVGYVMWGKTHRLEYNVPSLEKQAILQILL